MTLLKSVVLLCCLYLVRTADVETEEHVLVLKSSNFDDIVKEHKHILVEFYAPWCGHCKALAPEYAKAAKALAEENSTIKLAKVDATVETELAEKQEVKGYPTIKFFSDGTPMDFRGGRTADEIIRWLKKKTGPAAVELSSVELARTFVDGGEVAVVGFFKDTSSKDAKAYLQAAAALDDYTFGLASDEAVYKELKVEKDGVVLFKKFDEGRSDFEGDFTVDAVKSFIRTSSLPLVVEFTHESAQKVFGGDVKSHNLLFLSKKSPDYESLVDTFREVAKEFRNKVLFVTINTDDEDHARILEFFGLKKDETPQMRIIQLAEDMTKFKPETAELKADDIRNFVQGVLDGKIKQILLAQDLPEDWDKNPVKVLVSSNFDEVVFNKDKDVLVEFYAPWCGHCKQLAPIYDELGEKYKATDNVVIAKMDATANELEHTKVGSFPTIKLYKKGTNEAVDYNGERTLDGLSKFLDSNGEYGRAAPEEVSEEEEEEEDKEDKKRDEL
uniref:Protein disulfide-isomerase n=1 Tax=Ornithodoros turicata TaxID=34597 RepID=A0A2R5LJC7_9ACAR